jgi:hypothetical protein
MCIRCTLKACPVMVVLTSRKMPARGKRGRDDSAVTKHSIFNYRHHSRAATGFFLHHHDILLFDWLTHALAVPLHQKHRSWTFTCVFHPPVCPIATSALPKRLSAAHQHLRVHHQKADEEQTGRTSLGDRRAEEPSFHAQRRLLVPGAQEKNTGSVRSLASQKATTCCPRAIVAEGRSATFLHVLCICAPPSDSSA